MGMESLVSRKGRFLNGYSAVHRDTGNELVDRRGGLHIAYRKLVNRLEGNSDRVAQVLDEIAHLARGTQEVPSEQWLAVHAYLVPPRTVDVRGTGLPREPVTFVSEVTRIGYIQEAIREREEAFKVPVYVHFPLITGARDNYRSFELTDRVTVLAHNCLLQADLSARMLKVEQALLNAAR